MKLFLGILVASLALVGAPHDAYDLVWKPKPDQAYRYGLTLDTTVDGSKTSYQADLAVHVLKVEKNGDYTVSSLYRSQKLVVDGKTQEIADDDGKPQIDRFNAHGDRLDAGVKEDEIEADPLARTLGDLTEFAAPAKAVKTGDKWTKIIPGNARKNISPAKLEYVVSGPEKTGSSDSVKVAFTYNETQAEKPVHGSGAMWIDLHDGCLLRLDAAIANLRLEEGGAALGQAHLDVVRK